MAKLSCLSGFNQGDEFVLKEGVTTIGRADDVDIKLFDKKCSRYHCQIFKKGKYYAVKDLDSSNGTWLGKKRIKGTKSCKPGSRIHIGYTWLALSEKAIGSFVDQIATDVSADLQSKDYSSVFASTKSDLKTWSDTRRAAETGKTESFLKRFKKKLFGK